VTAEVDRRQAFIKQALWELDSGSVLEQENTQREASNAYTWVLNYFTTNEPAIADAIRYGLREVDRRHKQSLCKGSLRDCECGPIGKYEIKYPEGVKPL
jgi:predicted deacetylase